MENEKDNRDPAEGLGATKTPQEEAMDKNDLQEGEDKDVKGVKTKKKEKRKDVSGHEDEALNEENKI